MNIRAFLGWLMGNSTGQSTGSQSPMPATTAHDYAPATGPDSALQISAVWACVKLLTETISSLPLHLYNSKDGIRERAETTPLYTILRHSPNKRHTAQEFWQYMMLNLVLRGNAYAHIRRTASGQVVSIWPLAAEQMTVETLADGSLAYIYTVDDKELIYAEADILHIRGMGNGVVGMSPLDYMRSTLGMAIDAQNHTTKTFRKEARRPGILMSDNVLTDEQRRALKNNFTEIVEGGQRELFILEAGFKFEPLGMTPADLQLLETRRFAIEDLARWFGVPSVLINDASQSTTWGSGVQEIVRGFYKLTIRPQLVTIEQALNRRVLSNAQKARGMFAEFNFDALLRSNREERLEGNAKAVQNGIETRNEVRKRENLPPLPGGDELTAQTNLAPLTALGATNQGQAHASQETIAQ